MFRMAIGLALAMTLASSCGVPEQGEQQDEVVTSEEQALRIGSGGMSGSSSSCDFVACTRNCRAEGQCMGCYDADEGCKKSKVCCLDSCCNDLCTNACSGGSGFTRAMQ